MVGDAAAFLLALAGGYLLGSIPFGLVLTRLAGLGDIRKIGSGNIGATNVLRTGNKPLALLVLLLDSGKGAIAVLVAASAGQDAALAAGIGAVLGHLWPVGLIACALWLLTALISRMSSLAALVAIATTPMTAYVLGSTPLAGAALLLAALVWFKHGANIERLLNGTEPRISLGGKPK